MHVEVVLRRADPRTLSPPPNLANDREALASFTWEALAAERGLALPGRINASVEAIDRAPPDRRALTWVPGPDGAEEFTFARLAQGAGRFANMVRNLGAQRGDVLAAMLPRCPELVHAAFGALRAGGVFALLDPAWPDDRLLAFLARPSAKQVYVEARHKARLDPMRRELEMLWHVVSVERFAKTPRLGAGDFLFHDYFDPAPAAFVAAATTASDPALAIPAGDGIARHGHAFALGAWRFARDVLDLRPGDRLAIDLPAHEVVWVAAMAGAWMCGAEVAFACDGLAAPAGTVLLARRVADLPPDGGPYRHHVVLEPIGAAGIDFARRTGRVPHSAWVPAGHAAPLAAHLRVAPVKPLSVGLLLPGVALAQEGGRLWLTPSLFVGPLGDAITPGGSARRGPRADGKTAGGPPPAPPGPAAPVGPLAGVVGPTGSPASNQSAVDLGAGRIDGEFFVFVDRPRGES